MFNKAGLQKLETCTKKESSQITKQNLTCKYSEWYDFSPNRVFNININSNLKKENKNIITSFRGPHL